MGEISIYLTGKHGNEQNTECLIEYKYEVYRLNFKKLTISITYLGSNYKVTFKFRKTFLNAEGHFTKVFYRYITSYSDKVLEKIEVYISKLHENNPLVVGFKVKRKDSFKYFTYTEIKTHSYTYEVPSSGGFLQNNLDTKLNLENKHRNKVIFNFKDKQNQNYDNKTDVTSIPDYVKYSCFAKDDDEYIVRKLSKEKLFEKEKLKDPSTIDNLLKNLDGQQFDFINIYYCGWPVVILLIEFIDDSTKTHFVRKDETGEYWVKEEIRYTREGELKGQLNQIKSSLSNLSFMLDKNVEDIRFKSKITISRDPQSSLKFTKYIHKPNQLTNASVFYNDVSISITEDVQISDKLQTVQDKSYEKIETYSLDIRNTMHLLLKFTLSGDRKEYYFRRVKSDGSEWKRMDENEYLRSNGNIKNKLLEINYLLHKSLVLEINKTIQYNSGIVSNSTHSLRADNSFTVNPVSCSSCGKFICYNHDLSRYKTAHKEYAAGIRLKCNSNEVKLYNGDPKEGKIQYMYYDESQKYFYVYFYPKDTRPLMLCYNYKAYRAASKENFDQFKFSVVDNIHICPCSISNDTFTTNLSDIYDQLNEVDISAGEIYTVHTYNNNDIKINVRPSTAGCYTRYRHTPSSANGLGNIKYRNYHIKDSSDNNSIKASGYKELSVYYSSKDTSRKTPLLVALCTSNSNNSSLYYELKNNDINNKTYKKVDGQISLSTNSNGSLYVKLDGLFYTFTKSLCIVLNKHVGNYTSKLIGNKGTGNQGNSNIGVQEINCQQLTRSGYKCLEHNIKSVTNISEVGGLQFYIWDNEGPDSVSKEINLYSDSGGNSQITNIKYTSCKGNVLVFFYESDPRPLLLCFDSKWYRPKDKENYDKKWVITATLERCNCTETGIMQANHLLAELYKISMELNPLNLKETASAYKGLGKTDSHSYTIHNYSPRPIKVKITSENLVCYKKYVHQPENGSNAGYRLGKINYEGLTNYGLSYPEHRPLQRVSLYYSVYDTQHNYPLLVELGFKLSSFEDSEYHKLDDKKTLKWDSLSSDKYKYLLEKFSKKETFENGLYDIRTGLSIAYDKDQKKQYFFDPDKCTEDNLDVGAIAGGTVGAAAVIGTGITIGIVVAKKLVIVAATTAAVA